MTHPVLLLIAVVLVGFGVFLARIDRRVSSVESRQARAALRILVIVNLLLSATIAVVALVP